ncbi:hypothetical protein FOMPIDRAFT_1048081 [Fomitopsis schrenkii]|uniref:Ribonuclease H1 N-terminal domain-containing protein n=1 Tax=Fomitopsis schrenkii TaxID=2126942 RepID=S8FL22_FOMSC|nr:hypothetical protein FOMPIDRAFT_1048081 [Fomitopsis schrenkii]
MLPNSGRNKAPDAAAAVDAVGALPLSVDKLRDLISGLNMLAEQQEDDELWASVDGVPAGVHEKKHEVPLANAHGNSSSPRKPLPREFPAASSPRVRADVHCPATPSSNPGGWTYPSDSKGTTTPPGPVSGGGGVSGGGNSGDGKGSGGGGGGGGGNGGGGNGGGGNGCGGGIPPCGNCGVGVEGLGTGTRYYCIVRGRAVSVFVGWTNASPLVTGVPNAIFQRYATFALALSAFQDAAERGQVHIVL